MNREIDQTITVLIRERDRLNQAIQWLQQLDTPPGKGKRGRKPNTMTQAERAQVSRRMKQRWEKVRANQAASC